MVPTRESAETAPFYIFNASDDQGFVIISGDDRTRCVIGYSSTGSFDYGNIPPQLADLLNRYADYIGSIPADTPTHPSWKTPVRAESSDNDVILPTAEWGQGAPYNALCPEIDGVHAPTGCVATAMAILMKYHNWPDNYDWAAMPVEDINETNSSEIASLMKDAGESVRMDYGADISNAYTGLVSQAFFEDFGYSHDAQMISLGAGHLESDMWVDLIYTEIKQSRPIIYVGSNSKEGHAFILDGFDNKGLFHINWGWNGAYNGFYDLSALMPYDGANFSDGQGMVLSIKPGKEEDDDYSLTAYIDYGYLVGIKCFAGLGLNPEDSEIIRYQPVHISYGTLNVRPHTWFGIALVNKEMEIKEILNSEYCSVDKSDDDTDFIHYLGDDMITVTSEIEDTDRLHLIARSSESSPWKLVRGTIETPSSQPIKGIESKLTNISWNVPDGITIKYHYGNNTFEGTPATIAKGTLLDVYAYSNVPGTVKIDINGFNNYSDISAWEYDAVGALATTYCLDDNMDISVSFTPESSYLDIEIDVEEPGNLEQKLQGYDLSIIKGLTVTGFMDQRDFTFIRTNLRHLEKLDLGKITVSSYDQYLENHLPEEALHNLSWLKKLVLPDVEVIESMSLGSLTKLHDIEIPASVKEIQDDAFYFATNLKRIVFKNPIPFKGTQTSLPEWLSSYGFIVVPEGTSEQYRQTPYADRFSRIIEGNLIPAVSIKLVINDKEEQESNTLMPLFVVNSMYRIELEPKNSTDYIVGGTKDNRIATMDISSREDGLYCNLTSRTMTGDKTVLILETSSGAKVQYDVDALSPITDLYFEEPYIALNLTENRQLQAKVSPSRYPVTYSSSDPEVVSIDSFGNIQPYNEGMATITATASDPLKTHTATCKVTVKDITTAINDLIIDTEKDTFLIYNLQGICIRRNATQADVDALPAGIYIVNGRKMIVN